jgi:hypothetical protein
LNGLNKNIGSETPGARMPMAVDEETAVYGVNDESFFRAACFLTPEH